MFTIPIKGLSKIFQFLIASFLLIAIISGCSPKAVHPEKDKDDFGCNPPPPDVFTSSGIDIKFAELTFNKVLTGKVNIKTDPQLLTLTSKALTDDRIQSYLRCLSIKRDGYTREQAVYFDNLAAFMRTNPNSDQFIAWQNKNQFPNMPNPSSEIVYKEVFCKELADCNKYPLKIGSFKYKDPHPQGTGIGGIDWKDSYVDVRVNMDNRDVSGSSIEEINFQLYPECNVADVKQLTNIPNVSTSIDGIGIREISFEHNDKEGTTRSIPLPVTQGVAHMEVSSRSCRISCEKLMYGNNLSFALACHHCNYNIKINEKTTRTIKGRQPRGIILKGSYLVSQTKRQTKYHVDVKLLFED